MGISERWEEHRCGFLTDTARNPLKRRGCYPGVSECISGLWSRDIPHKKGQLTFRKGAERDSNLNSLLR